MHLRHPIASFPILVALACVGCLRSLDPALLEEQDAAPPSRCAGGTPNGVIEADEPCDDNNLSDDDGCSTTCDLLCPGLLDDKTGTCYFVASPEVEPGAAYDRCEDFGDGVQVLGIRGDRERDMVAAWLETTPLDEVLAGLYAENATTWRAISAGTPGWSAAVACPGCYADWADGQPATPALRRIALLSRSKGWRWVTADERGAYPLVCERPRPGEPENLCELPACDPASWYEFVLFSNLYRVSKTTLGVVAAQLRCMEWGGNLVVIDDEEERAALVRFGPTFKFWVGLHRPEGDWQWVDGVTSQQRPIPWSSVQPEENDAAAVFAPKSAFDTHLIEPVVGLGELQYVCRKQAPPPDAGDP